MSKSLGNILDPLEIIEKYGIDQLRYYLVKEVSLGTMDLFLENLKIALIMIWRIIMEIMPKSFCIYQKNCDNKIPYSAKLNNSDKALLKNLKSNLPKLQNLMDNQDLNEYIKTVVDFHSANKYFNDSEPWTVKKRPRKNECHFIYYC